MKLRIEGVREKNRVLPFGVNDARASETYWKQVSFLKYSPNRPDIIVVSAIDNCDGHRKVSYEPLKKIIKNISMGEFRKLCANSEILRMRSDLPGIIRHDANLISKVWHKKKPPSSDWIYPYYLRFCRNAEKLHSRQIVAPKIRGIMKVKKTPLRIVTYEEISGNTVRDIVHLNKDHRTVSLFVEFISKLHDKGILFTSLHMGNVISLDDGDFGLIDVSNTRFYPFSLSLRSRVRNLCHLMSNRKDTDLVQKDMNIDIVDEYLKHMDRSLNVKNWFSKTVKKKLFAE